MPNFMSKTTDLTVYHIDNPAAITVDKLKRFAFQPIDAMKNEELSVGCTSFDDMLDTTWAASVPEKGEWLCFALRADKRTVQGSVLKKHYAEALQAEKEAIAAQGLKCIPKGRKTELKEQIKQKLLVNIEPAPTIVDVAMNMHTGLLLVGSTAKGMLDHLQAMSEKFGVTLQQKMPQVDVQRVLRAMYDDNLHAEFNGHAYTLTDAGRVTLAGADETDDDIEVVVKNDRTSADAGLASGLSIAKLKVTMERDSEPTFAWTFAINGVLAFSGMKTPTTEKSDQGDNEAVLLEKIYLIEQAVGVIHALFEIR